MAPPARDTEGMNTRTLALVVLLFAMVGCGRSEPSSGTTATPTPVAGPSPTSGAFVIPRPSTDRALVVTVDTSLRVTDVNDASAKIRAEVESAGGYVASSNARGGDDAYATMELRVPSNQTAAVRKTLASFGDVTSETEKVDDVTEQRADLAARLHNARTQEARLLELMTQKTGTIAEVIDAEKELSRVRETVERLEAEQRTLESQIVLSTIRVTLTTPSSVAWQTPGQSVAGSWNAGVKGAKAIAVYGAMAVAALAPTFLPLIALALVAIAIVRRRNRRSVAA